MRATLALLALLLCARPAAAEGWLSEDGTTLLAHPDAWWWASGQANVITQYHPGFEAPYTGPNSLRPEPEGATSYVATLYLGARPTHLTEVFLDVESAGGRGLSDALGLGGITNLDVVRNPTLSSAPYPARAMVRQIIPLSDEEVEARRDALHLASKVPARRLEVRAGKLSTVDSFDLNSYGSDSHYQFMNWTADNNGAYDYAADTRGYTLGAVVEYQEPRFGVRLGELLMPTVANGIDYDFDVLHAHEDALEGEVRLAPLGRAGTYRLLAYLNHANMGSYRQANAAAESGAEVPPDITAHRARGRTKGGLGFNFEQALGESVYLFGRLGWNDGRNESFAYTEVDDTVELGLHLDGAAWGRPADRTAVALISNGLSVEHRTYLALGGLGFLLGDGALRYGREDIAEAYYTLLLEQGFYLAADLQAVVDPGYNQARGPVVVASLRLHLEL